MLPKNTSGVTDIFPIRWDDPQKLGWGILVEFVDGNYRTLFIGGKEQATAAVWAELKKLKFVERQNRSTG
jgi:hypothetical protein